MIFLFSLPSTVSLYGCIIVYLYDEWYLHCFLFCVIISKTSVRKARSGYWGLSFLVTTERTLKFHCCYSWKQSRFRMEDANCKVPPCDSLYAVFSKVGWPWLMNPCTRKRWFSFCLFSYASTLTHTHRHPSTHPPTPRPQHPLDSRGKQPGNGFLSYNTTFQDLCCNWEGEMLFYSLLCYIRVNLCQEDVNCHGEGKKPVLLGPKPVT